MGFAAAGGIRNLGRENEEWRARLVELPELALESILERLTPADLCRMGGVCRDLRERCWDNHLWERHMKHKWGRVVTHLPPRRKCLLSQSHHQDNTSRVRVRAGSSSLLFGALWEMIVVVVFGFWPLIAFFFRSSWGCRRKSKLEEEDSFMAQYAALESGQFWFPAQVHNRENGHAGFYLSWYDAHISYDSKTDTFGARYSSHPSSHYVTTRIVEDNISWSRIRAPPVDTPPYDLHISSNCLDLKPGDRFEIQWRKSHDFAYGWWYGVVGHEEDSCDGNDNHCQCHCSETVTLEFKQYPPNSRWRRTRISRKYHRQQGNKEDGFYGGIRKLYNHEEDTTTWTRSLA